MSSPATADCNTIVTMRAPPLQATRTGPTLAEAMEPLRLFIPETFEAPPHETESHQAPHTLVDVPTEHLEAAEGFLQTSSNGGQALATIQAAILLCEGAGAVSEEALRQVTIDHHSFPLAAAAVEWTRRALDSPRASWPEGFWPRFLLSVLSGEQPGR